MSTETTHKDLTLEDILAADDLEVTPHYVKQWGGNVYLRVMNAAEAMQFSELTSDPARRKQALMWLCRTCICDKKGTSLFTPDQLDQLKKKSIKVFVEVQSKVLKLNGLDKETKEEKEAAGNASGEAPTDDSRTA